MKIILSLLLVVNTCTAEHITVALESKRPWKYLGAFVYEKFTAIRNDTSLRGQGILPEVTWEHEDDELEIRFYYSGAGGEPWESANKWFTKGNNAADDDISTIAQACNDSRKGAGRYHQMSATIPVYDKRRDRVWHFIAVKRNCYFASQKDIVIPEEAGIIELKMHNPGGLFTYEFGVNKYFILQTLFVCTTILFMLFIVYTFKRFTDGPLHPITRFLSYTISVQVVALILYTSSYITMATTGEAHKNIMLIMGRLVDVSADTMFLLLVVVFSMGFKVLNPPGVASSADTETVQKRRHSLMLFFVTVCALRIAFVSVEVHEGVWNNISPYKSIPGILLAILRLPMAMYYGNTLSGTIRRSDEITNKTFFTTWGIIFSAHIIGLPIYVLLAEVVSPWVEYRVVFCADIAVRTILMVAMGAILMPGKRSDILLGSGYSVVAVAPDQVSADTAVEGDDSVMADEQL